MRYVVAIARSAQEQFNKLNARWRAALKPAMRRHLEAAPRTESKNRIKRFRGLRRPQYRLRVDEMRIYYDVNDKEKRVEVLGFVLKSHAADWLREHGVPE